MNHQSYTMMRQSHARVAEADWRRGCAAPTCFGPPPLPVVATKEAAEECAKLLARGSLPADVRTAATAIQRSYEFGTMMLLEHVSLVLDYMRREHQQNRYGK